MVICRLLLEPSVSQTLEKLEVPLHSIQTCLAERMISVVDEDGAGRSMQLERGPTFIPECIAIAGFETLGLISAIEAHLPVVSALNLL